MKYFDYEQTAREAGLSDERLDAIAQALRGEFPEDDMLWELHVLRACLAIRDGRVTFAEVMGRRAA